MVLLSTILYGFIVFLRITVPFFIFFNPLATTVISVFLDAIDAEFASHNVLTKTQYQLFDKMLDFWWYIFAMIFSYQRFPDFRMLLASLFFYRLAGHILFYITKERVALVIFANFFENVFLVILAGKLINAFSFLLKPNFIGFTLAIAFIAKLFQEWFLHYAKLSIREDFLKLKRKWVHD